MNNLHRIDLNLLVTLDMLLSERSVTRAARRLHLSQPSVSVRLRKLREIFSDELLVSTPTGMTPTAHAESLSLQLREALDRLQGVVERKVAFDPAVAKLTWQISAADYAEHAIVTPMISQWHRRAPGIRIAVRHASHAKMYEQLNSGATDLALLAMDAPPDHLHRHVLYREDYVVIARRRHPALRRKLTLDILCKLDHVVVSPDGGGFKAITDTMLESQGRHRRVLLSTQHFLFVPEVVARTDLVSVIPRRLAEAASQSIQILELPLRVPSYEMIMLWHARSENSPAHAWLRDQLANSLS